MNWMENVCHKKAGAAIIILDKADFITEFAIGKEELLLIQQKDIIIIHVYAPNNRV